MTSLRFHLQASPPDASLIPRLEKTGDFVGLGEVLADPDRLAVSCKVPARAAVEGFRWDAQDVADQTWFPQGITTSAEAIGRDLDGHHVILASWYAHGHGGSRISCVDYTDPARPTYRHIMLAEPVQDSDGKTRLEPVKVHAGGIVWYGPYLYVAGTRAGIRMFNLKRILRRDDGDYVVPQISSYAGLSEDGWDDMRYSFMSLDRSGEIHHLIAGEYGRRGETHRLTRYALDTASSLLDADGDGRSLPLELHEQQVERMQGAVLVDGSWVITSSQGEGRPGDLWVGQPGRFKRHRRVLPTGPEDVTYWPDRRQLWSLTEWPGKRWVYAMDAERWINERPLCAVLAWIFRR